MNEIIVLINGEVKIQRTFEDFEKIILTIKDGKLVYGKHEVAEKLIP